MSKRSSATLQATQFLSLPGFIGDVDLRCAIEVDAAAPKNPNLQPRLLDGVVLELLKNHHADPLAALAVAGQMVRDTPWSGYRSGRARMATMAACYLTWLVPPSPWRLVDTTTMGQASQARVGFVFEGPEGQGLIDLLACGDADRRNAAEGATGCSESVVGLRLLNLSAPRQSVLYTSPHQHQPLAESAWMFEGVQR
jgi:hypothetical protein